ncbi:hypothetical protein Tco_1384356 [Tanacetum coccineum]
MDEAHKSKYSVHPGADRMYYDLRDRLKAVHDRQKSYADKRKKPLEFSIGDYVLLKVSPWKGVVRFGNKGKLAPRFFGPFEIIEKAGPVAYRLDLPEELDGVHDTFHVSNLKKCLAYPILQVPLDEIQVDAKLNFVEEHVEILEREFKRLKRSRIAIVKVRWNSKRGPEFTWEREDQMKHKVCTDANAPTCRLLGAYDLRVATPRALVYAGLMTSGDARSWYMISGDAKSWEKQKMTSASENADRLSNLPEELLSRILSSPQQQEQQKYNKSFYLSIGMLFNICGSESAVSEWINKAIILNVCELDIGVKYLKFPSMAGVGPLSGKGPRVIVSADASILPRLSSPAIRCIGPGPIRVYYEPSPVSLVFILYVIKSPQSSLLTVCGTIIACEHLDAICAKYFVPEEVHPQLPSSDATMHERPAGKVGMYTRFFDYANYRIPFSTFFVSVLTHFRIPFSQLSVFGSAKFVVPANARFSWFSGSNIVKDRAPAPSEYNVEHVNALIAQASPFLRFPEEFLCWVGISRNYLLNKDTYPRFEYENGEEMDLNAFIRTADPRKVRIVERPRAENERPIVTVAKHRTVTLLPTSVVRSSGELSASVEREFVGDASVGDGGDQGFDSVGGQDNIEPTVPVTEHVETETPGPKRTKKKRVARGSERMPAASHPPKRLRADYGTTGVSATGGKSPSVLNRLLQDSRLLVEQGIPALPTLPFITSSVTASPLEEGGDHTDSATGTKSADPEVDSLARSAAPVMTEATTLTSIATTVAIPADVYKDKSAPHPSIFGSSSSSEKTDRTLSLFTGRSGSGFAAGSIRAEEAIGAGLEEIYVPKWTVTKGFELNDGHSCANMIDHFTPPAFFKTVRGMEHE